MLTKQDLDQIELSIRKVLDEREPQMFKEHIARCPYGKSLSNGKAFMIGVGFLLVVVISGLGVAITKIIKW